MTARRSVAAASNGRAAVAVCEFNGAPAVLRFVPQAIGTWGRRQEFEALVVWAAAKLGFRRCARGWRRAASK